MRIRSIKPEFWDDADLASDLTREQRLLYIGLWNLCYDNWTMEYDPRQVKKAIFGYDDDVTVETVAEWVERIVATGRAAAFVHGGHKCLYLPKCAQHQRVNRPSASPIPLPDSLTPPVALTDTSVSTLPGKEGKGLGAGSRSGEGTRALRATLPTCLDIESRYTDFPDMTLAQAVLRHADATFGWNGGCAPDRSGLIAVFESGCFPGCKHSEAQARDCASTAIKAIDRCAEKGATTWKRGGRGLFAAVMADRESMEAVS